MCTSKILQGRLKRLQKQYIIAPLRDDETSEWCNSFVLVSKANGKLRLSLDLAYLNQALIRPIHRGLTLTDILLKLNSANYLFLQMQAKCITTWNWMKNHLTSQCLCASLEGTDTNGCHLEQHQQVTCSKGKLMIYLRICQMYFPLQMIY